MTETITTEPAGKRGRNGSVVLTDRICQRRVAKRVKLYDRKCPGLFVSIHPSGIATFSFKFTERGTGKQRNLWLGLFSPAFTTEEARAQVYGLRIRLGRGENIADSFRRQKATEANRGTTVDAIIDERIDWMKTPVRKPGRRNDPGSKAGRTSRATCGASSAPGSARRSRAKLPSTTSPYSRTTSSRASSVARHR